MSCIHVHSCTKRLNGLKIITIPSYLIIFVDNMMRISIMYRHNQLEACCRVMGPRSLAPTDLAIRRMSPRIPEAVLAASDRGPCNETELRHCLD